MRLSLLWIFLGLALCAPATSAQNESLYGDIVVSDHEAFLDLSADFETTWSLLLNHWGEDALAWPQQALPETWVVVGDVWVRLEGLPYRSGTWTRARVRVGDFQGADEKGQAEALLYQLAVDLETLRELEQVASRELAANLAATAVGYDSSVSYGVDLNLQAAANYGWMPSGLMFSSLWLQWGWPWYSGNGYYPVVNNYYYHDDGYWQNHHYGHHYYDNYAYGWGGFWWDDDHGCYDNNCGSCGGGGNGNGGGGDGDGDGDGSGSGDGGGGGGNGGGGTMNPPILSWDGLKVAGNLPDFTGSYGARGKIIGGGGKDNGGLGNADPGTKAEDGGRGSVAKNSGDRDGDRDGVSGLGGKGPVTVNPGRSIVVRSSSSTSGRRSVALTPLPRGSGSLGTISTSGFGMGSSSGIFFGRSSGSSSSRTIAVAPSRSSSSRSYGSSSRPSPSPGLSSVARTASPSVSTHAPARSTPSYVPSHSPTFRGFGSSSRSAVPPRLATPRAPAPARAAPARSTPSRSAPAARSSGSRSSSSRSSGSSRGASSSSSSGRSSGSSARSSSSSGRSSSGRGGS